MMNRLHTISIEYDMNISTKKTKIMKTSKGGETVLGISVNSEVIEQVKKFWHLNSVVAQAAKCHKED